jgi:hypothetical protein
MKMALYMSEFRLATLSGNSTSRPASRRYVKSGSARMNARLSVPWYRYTSHSGYRCAICRITGARLGCARGSTISATFSA